MESHNPFHGSSHHQPGTVCNGNVMEMPWKKMGISWQYTGTAFRGSQGFLESPGIEMGLNYNRQVDANNLVN